VSCVHPANLLSTNRSSRELPSLPQELTEAALSIPPEVLAEADILPPADCLVTPAAPDAGSPKSASTHLADACGGGDGWGMAPLRCVTAMAPPVYYGTPLPFLVPVGLGGGDSSACWSGRPSARLASFSAPAACMMGGSVELQAMHASVLQAMRNCPVRGVTSLETLNPVPAPHWRR